MKHLLSSNVLFFFILLGILPFAIAFPASAQQTHFCHADELLTQEIIRDSSLLDQLSLQDQMIVDYANTQPQQNGSRSTHGNFIVPTVVYIIHDNGPENITDQQVISQIDELNDHFSVHGIAFCLAEKDGPKVLPGNPVPGIIRLQSNLTYHQTTDEAALKALSSLEGDRYMRIFVVKDINNNSGILGYARFPGTVHINLDGIVMRYDAFGNAATCGCTTLLPSNDQGKVLVHEAGHYLELYHTFHAGCTGTTTATCELEGDRVCDTPPVAVANLGCPATPPNSCPETPPVYDLIDNHMDYTDDNCRTSFTPGQETRMIAATNLFRAKLISSANLSYTGVQCTNGLVASFNATTYTSCVNEIISFDAVQVANSTYAWDFGDATTATGVQVSHNYAMPGTYQVTLQVATPSQTLSTTKQVYVSDCTPISNTQSNWFFGTYAGLDFSSGKPMPNTDAWASSTIDQNEGCITQSDDQGNLLFYSDGIYVWDNNHNLVNPNTPLAGYSSTSQSALSVPDPGNAQRYYLFTMPLPLFGQDPQYTILDVASGVSLVNPNTAFSSFKMGEAITAVQHCNETDYWIITSTYDISNARFHVFELGSNGIQFSASYPGAPYMHGGQFKMSPDGSLLAATTIGHTQVLDLDRQTGALSNPRTINKGGTGLSFSPDSKLLYVATSNSTIPFKQILCQYDLSYTDLFLGERDVIISYHPFIQSSLQLGPDEKIYVSRYDNDQLAVINYPNQRLTADFTNECGYLTAGPKLTTAAGQGIVSRLGLPNMIDARPFSEIPYDFTMLPSNCNDVQLTANGCAGTYEWDFGDGATGTGQQVTHTFLQDGTYTISLMIDNLTTLSGSITIGADISFTGPACDLNLNASVHNYSAPFDKDHLYDWQVSGGTITGLSNTDNIDVKWQNLPGTVTLTITDQKTGCSASTLQRITEKCCQVDSLSVTGVLGTSGNDHFSSGMTFSGDYLLKGDVILESGAYHLTPNTRFFVEGVTYDDHGNEDHHTFERSGPFIRVKNNAELIIDEAIITANCQVMWGGIIVDATSDITIKGTGSNMSEISHSRYGVVIYTYDDATSAYLNHFSISDTRFLHNYHSIWLGGDDDASTNQHTITNNIFDADPLEMLHPFDIRSAFEQYVTHKHIEIAYGNFTQTDISNNTISNCLYGLFGGDLSSPYHATGNQFYDNYIMAGNFVSLPVFGVQSIIRDNVVTFPQQPLNTIQYQYPWVIGFLAGGGCEFDGNTFQGTGSQSGASEVGLALIMENETAMVTNNRFFDLYKGLEYKGYNFNQTEVRSNLFEGNEYAIILPSHPAFYAAELEIKCNTFDQGNAVGNSFGIYVSAGATLNDQGSCACQTCPAGNKFIWGNLDWVSIQLNGAQTFNYSHYQNNNIGQIITGAQTIFNLKQCNSTSNPGSCPDTIGASLKPPGGGHQIACYIQSLQNKLNANKHCKGLTQQQLIAGILNFYHQKGCPASFEQLTSQISGVNQQAYNAFAWHLVECKASRGKKEEALQLVNEVISNNSGNTDLAWRSQLYHILLKMGSNINRNTENLNDIVITELEAISNSGSPGDLIACYLLLKYAPEKANCFYGIEQQTVTTNSIKRRSEHELIPAFYTPPNIANYPDPFSHITNIVIPDYFLLFDNLTLEVIDVTGKIVKTYPFGKARNNVKIDANDLNNGLYIYILRSGKKLLAHDKMVVIK